MRRDISGSSERPRLTVSKSLKYTTAQLIDDRAGRTIVYVSTQAIGEKKQTKTAAARQLGKAIAEKAREQGVKAVVFDRNLYIYHGRVRAVAEGAREGGLEF